MRMSIDTAPIHSEAHSTAPSQATSAISDASFSSTSRPLAMGSVRSSSIVPRSSSPATAPEPAATAAMISSRGIMNENSSEPR
jgi:hypothetical protein